VRVLPARPDVPIRLIDAEFTPDPDAIGRLNAFLVREPRGGVRPVIYLNRRSDVVAKAALAGDTDVAILAAVIHHEMAHLRGAPKTRRGGPSTHSFSASCSPAGCPSMRACSTWRLSSGPPTA
jgi:hypothetical protein